MSRRGALVLGGGPAGLMAAEVLAEGGAAVDVVDGVISGAVIGIGQGVGVPPTNMTACQRAIAEGRTWDASFACPAKDFLSYAFGPDTGFDAGKGNDW